MAASTVRRPPGRLQAVLCELVPGGVSKRMTAGQAAQILGSIARAGAVAAARCELAAKFAEDLRRIDAQMRDSKKKLAAVVAASATTIPDRIAVQNSRCTATGIAGRPPMLTQHLRHRGVALTC